MRVSSSISPGRPRWTWSVSGCSSARSGGARARGGTVCLVSPSRFVRAVVRSMGVERLFPTFDDYPAARAWLRGAATTAVPMTRR